MTEINIFTEVVNDEIIPDINQVEIIENARKLLETYIKTLGSKSCLADKAYNSITLDIVFSDSEQTHELNREYRDKDYPADIITFAIFADDENSFIFDGDINLGEIIIALDKVKDCVNKDVSGSTNWKQELYFLISHGLMHLLGFDHQTEAEYNFVIEEQKKALECINYDKIQVAGF